MLDLSVMIKAEGQSRQYHLVPGNPCASCPTTCRQVHVLMWQGIQNIHLILLTNDHQRRHFCEK